MEKCPLCSTSFDEKENPHSCPNCNFIIRCMKCNEILPENEGFTITQENGDEHFYCPFCHAHHHFICDMNLWETVEDVNGDKP